MTFTTESGISPTVGDKIMRKQDLPAILAHITHHWGSDPFLNGDCHTLAMALHQASAAPGAHQYRVGSLWACLRLEIDEDDQVITTGYSHMVYDDLDGVSWDIGGPGADERWAERFNFDAIDKWGLRTELKWVQVPHAQPDYADTHLWLQEHYGCIDMVLQDQLVAAIRNASSSSLLHV